MAYIRSATQFRRQVRCFASTAAERGSSLVVLAVDGLAFSAVERLWLSAELVPMAAAHPTSSLPGWATALTGRSVDEHGVAGVIVRLHQEDTVVTNLLTYDGPLPERLMDNIFRDAQLDGRPAFVIENDMCGWRSSITRALTTGATVLPGGVRFQGKPKPAYEIVAELEENIISALTMMSGPCLVWAFVELDTWIHRMGYAGPVLEGLTELGGLAERLSSRGIAVVVHSDHGAVPTRHEPELAEALEALASETALGVGGAGRVRWLWPPAAEEDRFATRAEQLFGNVAAVLGRSEYFTESSLAWRRIGSVVIEALGEPFILLDPSNTHEHGSRLQNELLTPLAYWAAG